MGNTLNMLVANNMNFDFKKCCDKSGKEIKGLIEILPKIFADTRGEFLEIYNKKQYVEYGLNMDFVQDNQSSSIHGVLRGLHFQTLHPQGKLIRAVAGSFYDVAVDLRKDSPTFGKYFGTILDDKKKNQLYIPEGFAHGFYVLSKSAICSYKCTDFYDPLNESGIMWNDPAINIEWPIEKNQTPILAKKDLTYSKFNNDFNYFSSTGKWIGK